MGFVVLIVAIVMGTVTFATLTAIWLGTSYSLRKHGYRPNYRQETLGQLQSDLQRISTDLDDIRTYIADLVIMHHDRTSKTS